MTKPNEEDYIGMMQEVALAVKKAVEPFLENKYPTAAILHGIVLNLSSIAASTPQLKKNDLVRAIEKELSVTFAVKGRIN